MTLKQMEYALTVAKCASLSEAAKRLFVSQPSLSESIRKLEEELGFAIFVRERTGVSVTAEGEELLNAIQGVVEQVANIEQHVQQRKEKVLQFSASVIHYFFMGEVFAEVINQITEKMSAYEVRLLDAGTLEAIEDVAKGLSEIGIISYTDHNRSYIAKELRRQSLDCYEMMSTRLCAFMRSGHPAAKKGKLTMKDLETYPYAAIWQNKSSMYYFTEEGIFLPTNRKKIYVRDCGAMRVLLRDTDAFAMGSGVMPSDVGQDETCAVEVTDAPITSICWIRKGGHELTETAKEFLEICASKLGRTLNL